jgi:hypothetical protein
VLYWNAGVTGHIDHDFIRWTGEELGIAHKKAGWGGEPHAAFLPH